MNSSGLLKSWRKIRKKGNTKSNAYPGRGCTGTYADVGNLVREVDLGVFYDEDEIDLAKRMNGYSASVNKRNKR